MTGGILDLTADQYHLDTVADHPSLSASIARTLLAKSPLHAWAEHPKLGGVIGRDTESMDTGTILHSLLLEGNTDGIAVLDVDDFRTKDAREQRDAARANGKIPVKRADWTRIEAMAETISERIAEHAAAPSLFSQGKPEQVLVWDEDGITCRSRLDWLRDDFTVIDDLKTTRSSVHPLALARTVFNAGYDVQAAFYLRGLRALTGKTADFRFVFVEVEPPYAVSVVNLSPAALALADEKVQHAISTWRNCLLFNTWPGYPTAVATLDPPAWAEAAFFDRVDMEREAA